MRKNFPGRKGHNDRDNFSFRDEANPRTSPKSTVDTRCKLRTCSSSALLNVLYRHVFRTRGE